MNIRYALLTTLLLEHDYYADNRADCFEIKPSPETAQALKGAGLLTKWTGDALLLLVQINEDGKALITPSAGLVLRFYLSITDTNFFNFTNLAYQPGEIFYFTNLPVTKVGSTVYLNSRVPLYDAAAEYAITDLVRNAAGNVYEAIKPNAAGSHPVTDTDYWTKRALNQYVHPGDRMLLTDGLLKLETSSATQFTTEVFSLRPETGIYNLPLGEPVVQNFPEATTSIKVDLRANSPGTYKIVVNGIEHLVYKDTQAVYQRVLGVIELFQVWKIGAAAALIDAEGKPKGQNLLLRFAGRLALWKYITRTDAPTSIVFPGQPNVFVSGSVPHEFLSVVPLPMSETPIQDILLKTVRDKVLTKLANPPPDRIAQHTDANGNMYYCAEMYVNY